VDRLAAREADRLAGDMYKLVVQTDQVHLDPARVIVPVGAMREGAQIEICTGFAIQPHQQIAIECRGDALRIVVGRQQDRRVLAQIDAHQEPRPIPKGAARRLQEALRL
jgi:hypothetical protein